jgi:hypothetical protein
VTLKPESLEILDRNGWSVDCESPFEISRPDGTFARYEAADRVVHSLLIEDSLEKAHSHANEIQVILGVIDRGDLSAETALKALRTSFGNLAAVLESM